MNESAEQKTTTANGTKYVTMPGPGGTSIVMTPEAKEEVERHANILRITPEGENPVIYWHQVAQDAIKSAEKERIRAKQAQDELGRTKRSFDNLTERIATKNAEYRTQIEKAEVPFDLSRLVGMAGEGTIDLNVTIQIKGKRRMPLYEHEEDN